MFFVIFWLSWGTDWTQHHWQRSSSWLNCFWCAHWIHWAGTFICSSQCKLNWCQWSVSHEGLFRPSEVIARLAAAGALNAAAVCVCVCVIKQVKEKWINLSPLASTQKLHYMYLTKWDFENVFLNVWEFLVNVF